MWGAHDLLCTLNHPEEAEGACSAEGSDHPGPTEQLPGVYEACAEPSSRQREREVLMTKTILPDMPLTACLLQTVTKQFQRLDL